MAPYDRRLLVQYHRAELLREAQEARLARAAHQAASVTTTRLDRAPLAGPVGSLVTSATAWVRRLAAGMTHGTAPQRPAGGRIVLHSTHLR